MHTRRQVDSQWYAYLLSKDHTKEATMEVSRPGTGVSSNQMTVDNISWVRSRISSPKPPSDLGSSFNSKTGSSKVSPDLEDVIKKKTRPLSVALGKYNPLPAISSSMNNSSSFSEYSDMEASSSIHNDVHLMEPLEFSNGISTDVDPPKLIRSRTFEVIETNLSSLPIINNCDSENSSKSDFTEGIMSEYHPENTNTAIQPSTNAKESNSISGIENNVFHCIISIDGMPLSEYIGHEMGHRYHNGMSIVDILNGHSRPPSRSSLITHPGTPDSLFYTHATDKPGREEINLKSSRSSRYTVLEDDLNKKEDSQRTSEYLYVKFPDDSIVVLPWTGYQTLKELLGKVQNLEFHSKPIHVCDLEHLSDELLQPIVNFGIDQSSTINLLAKKLS